MTITIEQVRRRAEADAKSNGSFLIPDPDLLLGFLEGLKTNEERYGYPVCPCRLASRNYEFDRDIICPCDYRDPDIAEFGACYCRLYVSKDVFEGKKELPSVPERRSMAKQSRAFHVASISGVGSSTGGKEAVEELVQIGKKLWYCKQCGYVVFREDPPFVCPVCRAKREFFVEIKTKVEFSG